jgi:hypothetical protein
MPLVNSIIADCVKVLFTYVKIFDKFKDVEDVRLSRILFTGDGTM